MTERPPDAGWDRIWVGAALTLPLHLLLILVAIIVAAVTCLVTQDSTGACALPGLIVLLFFGVVQLLYMLPAIVIAHLSGRRYLRTGLIIGAAITFLLNAACWGTIIVPGMFLESLPFSL